MTSDAVLEDAFGWLCRERKDYSPHNDVWDVRWRWPTLKPELQHALCAGTYRLGPVQRVHVADETREIWAALDALVLKACALVLTRALAPQLSPACYHVAGHGGLKTAVRAVQTQLPDSTFVFRSDVKGYYASITHAILLDQLRQHIAEPVILDLVTQCLARTVYDDGLYQDVSQGLSLSCPLSPLLGALYPSPLDDAMEQTGLLYVRYMDDWCVLAPTRWKLRAAIRQCNQVLAALQVAQHPDKTFIGRIVRGFDFLGYWLSPQGLGIAVQPPARRQVCRTQLSEQGATGGRRESFGRRWAGWVRSTVQDMFTCPSLCPVLQVVCGVGWKPAASAVPARIACY